MALPVLIPIAIVVLTVSVYDAIKTGRITVVGQLSMLLSAVFLIMTAFVLAARRSRARANRREQALRELHAAEAALKGANNLELVKLWTTTQSRLNYYHEIATSHAQQSFRNAQIAAGIGFVLLLAFAIMALRADTLPATIATSTLGAISAALAGFIGRTFIRSQESAASHLHAYFDQPVKFSRYLAAERLIAEMMALQPEQRAAISGELLRTIIAPDSAPSGGLSPSGASSEQNPDRRAR